MKTDKRRQFRRSRAMNSWQHKFPLMLVAVAVIIILLAVSLSGCATHGYRYSYTKTTSSKILNKSYTTTHIRRR